MLIIWGALGVGWLLYFLVRSLEKAVAEAARAQDIFNVKVSQDQDDKRKVCVAFSFPAKRVSASMPESGKIQDTITGKVSTMPIRKLHEIKPENPRLN